MSSTAEELSSQAEQLQDTIGFFKVGGDADGERHGKKARKRINVAAGKGGIAKQRCKKRRGGPNLGNSPLIWIALRIDWTMNSRDSREECRHERTIDC